MPWDLQPWLGDCLKHEALVKVLDLKFDQIEQSDKSQRELLFLRERQERGTGIWKKWPGRAMSWKGRKRWGRGGVPQFLACKELSHASDVCTSPSSCSFRELQGPRGENFQLVFCSQIRSPDWDVGFWIQVVKILGPFFQGKAIQPQSKSLWSAELSWRYCSSCRMQLNFGHHMP